MSSNSASGSEPSTNGTPAPRRMELALPAAHRTVRMARNLVRRFARMDGLPPAEVDNLMLVATELLDNAVDHGGGNAAQDESEVPAGVRMGLELELSADGWTMSISDQGGGDPAELEALVNPEGLPDLEDERGRGFFLLSTMVDEMQVAPSADGKGITVRAHKRLERD